MPTNTYTALATTTLSSTTSSLTFSSISGYRDLVIIAANTEKEVRVRFNADTGSNYSWVRMWGEGSGGQSSASSGTYLYTGDGSTAPSMVRMQIMDAGASDKHKTMLSLNAYNPGSVNYNAFTVAGRWANNSAISSITLLSSNLFPIGSTFSLFGIAS